jgi:phosphotransferase system IIA component
VVNPLYSRGRYYQLNTAFESGAMQNGFAILRTWQGWEFGCNERTVSLQNTQHAFCEHDKELRRLGWSE